MIAGRDENGASVGLEFARQKGDGLARDEIAVEEIPREEDKIGVGLRGVVHHRGKSGPELVPACLRRAAVQAGERAVEVNVGGVQEFQFHDDFR